jgi:hypothetical protein
MLIIKIIPRPIVLLGFSIFLPAVIAISNPKKAKKQELKHLINNGRSNVEFFSQ